MGLQSCILNCLRIFLMYGSCKRDNKFFDRPLEILTLRIYAASPIFFISNLDDNHPLISFMYFTLFPAISMSSTYKDKTANLCFNLLMSQ